MRPVSEEYRITQGFGEGATAGVVPDPEGRTALGYLVWQYGDYQHDGHAGTDIGCPVGTPVRAARSGTVVWCDWDVNLPGGVNGWSVRWFFYQRFGGRILVIQHAPGDLDVYAHLSAFKVGYGQFVQEGDLVALSGDSSAGEDGQLGPHLHTERIVDLNYTTGGGLIYGRTDPSTVWGGLSAQGTITEDDDVTAKDVWEFPITINGKEFPAYDVLRYNNLNAARARELLEALPGVVVEALLKTALAAPDGSGRSYTVAEYLTYGWWYSMQGKDRPAGELPAMDVAAVADAVSVSVAAAVGKIRLTTEDPEGK